MSREEKPMSKNIKLDDLLQEQSQDEPLATPYLEEFLADENIDLFRNALKDVTQAMTDDQLKTLLRQIAFNDADLKPVLAVAADLVSAFVQEELDEREWDAIVANPHVMKRMVELAEKARQEYLEGKTVEGGFGRETTL